MKEILSVSTFNNQYDIITKSFEDSVSIRNVTILIKNHKYVCC